MLYITFLEHVDVDGRPEIIVVFSVYSPLQIPNNEINKLEMILYSKIVNKS